jgi:hypothetical protein
LVFLLVSLGYPHSIHGCLRTRASLDYLRRGFLQINTY